MSIFCRLCNKVTCQSFVDNLEFSPVGLINSGGMNLSVPRATYWITRGESKKYKSLPTKFNTNQKGFNNWKDPSWFPTKTPKSFYCKIYIFLQQLIKVRSLGPDPTNL